MGKTFSEKAEAIREPVAQLSYLAKKGYIDELVHIWVHPDGRIHCEDLDGWDLFMGADGDWHGERTIVTYFKDGDVDDSNAE